MTVSTYRTDAAARLSLTIAGISILLKGSSHINFGHRESYRNFLSSSDGDIELTVHDPEKGVSKYLRGETIFDTGITWRLNRDGRRKIFSFYSLDHGKHPYETVSFDEAFKTGDIHIDSSFEGAFEPFDYPLDEVLMVSLLAEGRGIMAHGCGMEIDGEGVLFVGVSGRGKSTMAKIAVKNASAGILNDDRTIIRRIGGQYYIFGTPWHGEVDICSSKRVPLKKIFFIHHSKENTLKPISAADAVSRFISTSFPPFWSQEGMGFTLEFLTELVTKVPTYELGFLPDERVLALVNNKA